MKKKILSVFLATTIVISLIGCGTKEETSNTTNVEETVENVVETEVEEVVEEAVETEIVEEVVDKTVAEDNLTEVKPEIPHGKIEITTENFDEYFDEDEYCSVVKNNFDEVESVKVVRRFILKKDFESYFDPQNSNLDVEIFVSYDDFVVDVNPSTEEYTVLNYKNNIFEETKVVSFFHDARGYDKGEKPIWYGVISTSQNAGGISENVLLSNYATAYEVTRVAGYIYLR